jgi:hypothetical protein
MSLLMGGGGGKSASFEKPGDKVSGEILTVESRQQTDLDGALKCWDNGDPMWQVVVTLQTTEREDGDDDGKRTVYLKGSRKYASTATAVGEAVKAAGAKTLEVGGTLALAYTGDGEPTKRGFSAPKLYQAAYKPPAQGVDLGDLLGGDAPGF